MNPSDYQLEVKRLTAERDRAQALADARSDLVAHVSHEMRAPLNGILGMAQLLLESDLQGEQRELTELINVSGEALLTLINDLLDHSKIQAGKLSIDALPFDLPHAVGETVRTLELSALEKGLTLALTVESSVPTMVLGDPGRLRQILYNLVGNAIKFTHEGGVTVSIAVDAVEGHEVTLRFGVKDSGVGMTPDRAEAIFKPFEQADTEIFRGYGGTGLGLAISQRLTEMMGGRIWVDSEPGVGSTFWFTTMIGTDLPAATGASGLPVDREQLEVIVVTDALRRAVANGVADAATRFINVGNSAQAAEALSSAMAERPAHLVIMDFRDEGLDAPRAAIVRAGDAKVIVLTPGGKRGDAAKCRELGIAAYLTGTVTARDVAGAIDAIVDGVPALITRHWLREQAHR